MRSGRFDGQRRGWFYPKADIEAPDDYLQGLSGSADLDLGLAEADLRQAVKLAFGETCSHFALTAAPVAGTFHRLYHVRGLSHRWILRVNAVRGLIRDTAMLLDYWVANRVSRRLALPQVAPSVTAVDVTREQVPFEFEVIEAVDGVCLKDFDEDEARTLRALASLGSLAARLHSQPMHGNGLLDAAPLADSPGSDPRGLHERWSDYVLLRLHEHIARCHVLGIVDEREGEWIDGEFRRASDWLDDVPAVLLHGDLGSHNVFVNGDDEASTLVDWEDALAGDPLYEIAFWATFHPQRRWAAFLEGYRRISNLPDDAGRRFWLYFLRIALAKTVVRDRFGLKDRPGRTPAVQRIRQAVDGLKRIGEGRSSLEAAIAARC